MGIAIANTPCISIHAPREGGDRQVCRVYPAVRQHFNPRPPRGGRLHGLLLALVQHDFNPRPPRGGRPRLGAWRVPALRFQSTPPARGATKGGAVSRTPKTFQSTPPARGATAAYASRLSQSDISIHAPREGGDPGQRHGLDVRHSISIHAPREGGDARSVHRSAAHPYFNPCPPRGGRR